MPTETYTPQYTGILPIIKIIGKYCNLRCKYCFYTTLDQSQPTVMNLDTLETVIEQTLLYAGTERSIRYIWHGGEPLLAGLEFFQKIVDLQKKYNIHGRTIRNAVQTNGTLINQEWVDFFLENDFGVGVSLDGSPQSHDRMRVDMGNRGTFHRVVKGIKYLQDAGISITTIMVLRKDNVCDLESSFSTFTALGLKGFGANPYFEASTARDHSFNEEFFLTPDSYSTFLKNCIDLWLSHNEENFGVREIDDFVAGMLGIMPSSCLANGTCSNFITIDYDGKVYPCERLPHGDENCFGDLNYDNLLNIVKNSPKRQSFVECVTKLPEECHTCPTLPLCRNGCTHHRINGKNYYCQTRKDIHQYLEELIGKDIEKMRDRIASHTENIGT